MATMFGPVFLLIFSLGPVIGAAVAGYSEVYALWVAWGIVLLVAIWQLLENWKQKKSKL